MTHRACPVPSCGATAKRGHLMCCDCWRRVPRYIQASVHRTWRLLNECRYDLAKLRADYDRAVQQAIGAAVAAR